MFEKGKVKDLVSFCGAHKVVMSSFNLLEFVHMHHHLGGPVNHHVRDFLKQKLIVRVPVDVRPGEREKEREYVDSFDEDLLRLVRDPSDAVLLVQAMKLGANVLTRDKHHVFTTACENHVKDHGIVVLNDIPQE
jgi:hypothetical protein